MSSVQFQLLSDLHLETPLIRPQYTTFKIPPRSRYLALLGDIGYATSPALFDFLQKQLQNFQIVFFLLGNHEPYGTTFPAAKARFAAFASEMEELHKTTILGKFILLDQTRYDISPKLTVLGCTLFSHITPAQTSTASRFVTDFHAISSWSISQHNAAHASDLTWLNAQVAKIEDEEPEREIVVFTHHCPSKVEEVNDERYRDDKAGVGSAFVTDLRGERCWKSERVRMWGWGHTHFCFDVRDGMGRRLVGNQKGYGREEVLGFEVGKVVGIDGEVGVKRKVSKSRGREAAGKGALVVEQRLKGDKKRHRKCIVM